METFLDTILKALKATANNELTIALYRYQLVRYDGTDSPILSDIWCIAQSMGYADEFTS